MSLVQSVYSNDLSTPSKVGLYWREIGHGGERFIPTSIHYDSGGLSCTTDIFNSFFRLLPCWLYFEGDSLKYQRKPWVGLMALDAFVTHTSKSADSWLTHMSGGLPVSPKPLAIMGNSPLFGQSKDTQAGFQSASWWLHWFGDSLSSTGCAQLHILFIFFRSYFINSNFTRT